MIVSSINQKGGSGKSIISQNLAVQYALQGHKTAIIDADPTQNTMTWFSNRAIDDLELSVFCNTNHNTLRKTVSDLYNQQGYDVVIIDSPPSLQKIAREIILLSHLVIIPTQTTGGNDIWSTEQLAELIDDLNQQEEITINAYFLINRFQPNLNVSKMFVEALEAHSKEYQISTLNTRIHQRTAYGSANIFGKSVVEDGKSKAKEEIEQLAIEVESLYQKL